MKLLLVEDEEDQLNFIVEKLNSLSPAPEILTAKSRSSAFAIINNKNIDLAIIDLRIPTIDGALDHDRSHGEAIVQKIYSEMRGIPIIVCSAYGDIKLLSDYLGQQRKLDIFSNGKEIDMISYITKDDLTILINRIKEFVDQYSKVNVVSISKGGLIIDFSHYQTRALQILSSRKEGTNIKVESLSGLSSAKTLKVKIFQAGRLISHGVIKINRLENINDEVTRFKKHITTVLPIGSAVHIGDQLTDGCGDTGAIFYEFADGFDENLFDILKRSDIESSQIVKNLKKIELPWLHQSKVEYTRIGAIRNALLPDAKFNSISSMLSTLKWSEAEEIVIETKKIPQHCDLHGLNVLVNEKMEPIFIDYGDVNSSFASLDPLTLELSLLFHPSAEELRRNWPKIDDLKFWKDIDSYSQNCPYVRYLKECRSWAYESAEGADDKLIDALVYSYSIRQLKYPTTNHDFAITLAEQAINSLLS